MGRHRSDGQRTRWLLVAAVTVLVLTASTLAAVVLRGSGRSADRGVAAPPAAPAGSCTRTLRAVTASSFAPVLTAAAAPLARAPDCVRVQVDVADGRAAVARVARPGTDVWIPDDASWAGILAGGAGGSAGNGGGVLAGAGDVGSGSTVATSPIYMVADRATAGRVTAAGGSWSGLMGLLRTGPGMRLAVGDPDRSGDGMVAAGDLAESVWLATGMDTAAMALNAVRRDARTVGGAAPALPARAGEVGLVPEHALLPALSRAGAVAVLPGTDHTAILRYTWLPTAAAAGDVALAGALRRLLAVLTGPDMAAARRTAGLRGPGQTAPPAADSRLPATLPAAPFGVLAGHHVDHVLASWTPRDRRAALLVVVDASGSMADPTPGTGRPLIEVVREGVLAVGGLLPDDARLGLWEFGSQLDPPRDYRVVLPGATMDGPHRAALGTAVGTLVAHRTGTALYDTLLAAYRSAVRAYQPGMPNQVLVFTDGRNEDDPGGISAGGLTAALRAAADPARPVHLTVAVFGAAAEADVVARAVRPVHGYVDEVASADQVSAAFVHVAAGGQHG